LADGNSDEGWDQARDDNFVVGKDELGVLRDGLDEQHQHAPAMTSTTALDAILTRTTARVNQTSTTPSTTFWSSVTRDRQHVRAKKFGSKNG
jgi:hypothetical protein